MSENNTWHGTTIVLIRKDGNVVVAGDGQVSMGNTVIKRSANKVRKIGNSILLKILIILKLLH